MTHAAHQQSDKSKRCQRKQNAERRTQNAERAQQDDPLQRNALRLSQSQATEPTKPQSQQSHRATEPQSQPVHQNQ